MDNKFFTFIKPYLNFIDTGKIFRNPISWLYYAGAAVSILTPLYVMYLAIDNKIFSAPAKFIIAFILIWFLLCVASWIIFQIWWDRKDKVLASTSENDKFVAIPVFAHFVQTLGEVYGSLIAILGFGFSLISLVLLGSDAAVLANQIGLGFINPGVAGLIISPITGFIMLVVARVISELIRALADIANNTAK
jgi:hypothetical protein